jgi:hypothetical protein
MVTGKAAGYGRDAQGDWVPGFMTHAELVSELGSAWGERRESLVREARLRMRQPAYPRDLLMRLGIRPED